MVPPAIATYYEPFVGGGALLFELAARRRFQRAVISDANRELILCYQAVRDRLDEIVEALDGYRYNEVVYYETRALDPETLSPGERAARLIYLNRVGFNGLYRVNSAGLFNVPFGRHPPTIAIYDADRLRAASAALQNVEILCRDFEATIGAATVDDFVYFDPPYVPLSRTSNFRAYAQGGFDHAEQERLAAALRRLGARGVRAALSNSDCATTRALYRGLPRPERISVRRAINSVTSARGPVGELLVRSFEF